MIKNKPHIWVFDLDDTLYPRESGLWAQISARISYYVKNHLNLTDDEVKKRRQFYYQTYGGALQGMMQEGHIDVDDFLSFVHDIDYSSLQKDKKLYEAIAQLEGQKYIFTNGDRPHAERALQATGLEGLFDDIYDITAALLIPKPFAQTYKNFLNMYQLHAANIVMFEDSHTNLKTCKMLGMTTVLIADTINPLPDYIDIQAENLLKFFQNSPF